MKKRKRKVIDAGSILLAARLSSGSELTVDRSFDSIYIFI